MNKILKKLFVTPSLTFTANLLFGQDTRESEIRLLENIEREATMAGDSTLLFGKI